MWGIDDPNVVFTFEHIVFTFVIQVICTFIAWDMKPVKHSKAHIKREDHENEKWKQLAKRSCMQIRKIQFVSCIFRTMRNQEKVWLSYSWMLSSLLCIAQYAFACVREKWYKLYYSQITQACYKLNQHHTFIMYAIQYQHCYSFIISTKGEESICTNEYCLTQVLKLGWLIKDNEVEITQKKSFIDFSF